jgi:hypothetical protein
MHLVLRLKYTNGMISTTEVTASYLLISNKIVSEFPQIMDKVSLELGKQQDQFRLSIESRVENPEASVHSFNRTFQLKNEEITALECALPLEQGQTMFHIVNVYTKAAQLKDCLWNRVIGCRKLKVRFWVCSGRSDIFYTEMKRPKD